MLPTSQEVKAGSHAWQRAASCLCVAFGILFILNVHPMGDGSWYWYAFTYRAGTNLYRDMHFPMQPLFVLLSAWAQALFGTSWLASKVLAIVQVCLYSYGLYLVSLQIQWADWKKAISILATFGMTVMAFYARFDDFHITGQCLLIYSVYIVFSIRNRPESEAIWWQAAVLGVLAGLAVGNRLNDGGMLLLASFLCLAVFARRRRLAVVAMFLAASCATFLGLIALTGASLREWFQNTVVNAAAIKGGTDSVFSAPMHFPITTEQQLFGDMHLLHDLFFVGLLAALFAYLDYFKGLGLTRRYKVLLLISGLVAFVLTLMLLQQSLSGSTVLAVSDALTVGTYLLFCFFCIRLFHLFMTKRLQEWSPLELLFLFPFGQMIAGAMTSGESFLEAYCPLAFFLLLLPFVIPAVVRKRVHEIAYVCILAVLAAGSFVSKISHPYYWHFYNNRGLFLDRTWYHHPKFGPMYIEKPQLDMMLSMCGTMRAASDSNGKLLSMPWPYANYFCNIRPWHDYVQTWYDTSSKATIDTLMAQLKAAPPEWIVYQRSFVSIKAHEDVFHQGHAIPHRFLDRYIAAQLRSGAWSLPWQRCFGGADWLLIHTRPARIGEANDVLIPSTDQVNLCSRTKYMMIAAAPAGK